MAIEKPLENFLIVFFFVVVETFLSGNKGHQMKTMNEILKVVVDPKTNEGIMKIASGWSHCQPFNFFNIPTQTYTYDLQLTWWFIIYLHFKRSWLGLICCCWMMLILLLLFQSPFSSTFTATHSLPIRLLFKAILEMYILYTQPFDSCMVFSLCISFSLYHFKYFPI